MTRYALILPACDEAACIAAVLAEIRAVLDPARYLVAVGVNGSRDDTAALARAAGAIVGETAACGYGHGCQAAIDALAAAGEGVDAYIFVAADGANDPRDIPRLVAAHEAGAAMVLGTRTRTRGNWDAHNFHYVVANRVFGIFCGLLTGRSFSDLGPLRLIGRRLFDMLALREWTYGWTIEAQIVAAMLGATIEEIPVRERGRLAGEQKVSHVSWRLTLRIAGYILAAGLRSHQRAAQLLRGGPAIAVSDDGAPRRAAD